MTTEDDLDEMNMEELLKEVVITGWSTQEAVQSILKALVKSITEKEKKNVFFAFFAFFAFFFPTFVERCCQRCKHRVLARRIANRRRLQRVRVQ
jgi:hypothetical protein